MGDLSEVKIGDRLFVKTGNHGHGRIVPIDRITPSGRVITKCGEFNPNGRLRGSRGWDSTWARKASDDDIAGVFRIGLVHKLEMFRAWEKLSSDDLKTAAAIVDKYKLP